MSHPAQYLILALKLGARCSFFWVLTQAPSFGSLSVGLIMVWDVQTCAREQ